MGFARRDRIDINKWKTEHAIKGIADGKKYEIHVQLDMV